MGKMYQDFEQWLNGVLDQAMPIEAVAVCFNLYEETDDHWSIQLVATESFDEEDPDWPCYEVFTTGEELFRWQQKTAWEEILERSKQLVSDYLAGGKYADAFKKYAAVGIGFVDGDVEILFKQ